MAGASIKITVRDAPLIAAFKRVAAPDLRRAILKNIGIALVKSTRRRFATETDPQGRPWARLNPEYAKGKRGSKILQEQGMRGGLLGSITYEASETRVVVGTNKIYAAAQHFGATIFPRTADALVFRLNGRLVRAQKVTIPARPYLGISESDRSTIAQVVEDHISGAWNR
jgi:phage virion morphogenesis protein